MVRPRRRWRGNVVALATLLALAALAWYLTHRPPAAGPGGAQQGAARPSAGGGAQGGPGGAAGGPDGGRGGATTVGVATAERADIPVWLDALGTVTPSATVTVRPQVSGVLTRILFTEGQMVRQGQLLAEIDPRPFEMQLLQAQGQRQRDEAQLDNARLLLERQRGLLQQDSIARQDVDTQAALVRQLEGTVVSDKAAEGTARLNLGYTRIVAPVAGRVGLRVVDSGNLVAAGDAAGIAVITRLAPIDVEFAVPQDRVPDVQRRAAAGAPLPVSAFDRMRASELARGTFSTLNNQIDVDTGTVRAKARFANADGTLFPSQFVNVRVLLDTVRGAVVVPTAALRHGGDGDFVFVLQGDRTVQMRRVVQGLASGDRVAVAQGLQAGERVITEGADRLKDGARVQLPGDAGRPGAASGAAARGSVGRASGGMNRDGRAFGPGAASGVGGVGGGSPDAGRGTAPAP